MILPRTKIATIVLKRQELLYDCKNLGFIESDVMRVEDEHSRHQVADIGEDGNVDRVTRIFDLTFAKIVELCYPYSKIPVEDESFIDDRFREAKVYAVDLLVPDDFSQTTLILLERLMHELMVARVMEDWLGITNPEASAKWAVKAEGLEEDIRTHLNGRCGRVRKTQTPF